MSYNIRSQKWGDPTRGTESGEIEWSLDLSGGLKMASGFSMNDFTGAMQAAFDKWESVADIDFTYVGGAGGAAGLCMRRHHRFNAAFRQGQSKIVTVGNILFC